MSEDVESGWRLMLGREGRRRGAGELHFIGAERMKMRTFSVKHC